jgi:negative regulator of flagellin synthesis FlgM
MPTDRIQQPPPRSAHLDSVQDFGSVREVEGVKASTEGKSAPGNTGQADSVEISERALELARAQQAVEAAPDVRADKVSDLKQQIKDGTYSMPVEALADKILDGEGGW